MKITWIGQAGLVIKTNELSIIVDPYLSNSCFELSPLNNRRFDADKSYLKEKYDVIIFTHDHLDHTDPESYIPILENNPQITVLAPKSSWDRVRGWGSGPNYVMFNKGTTWTEKDTIFKAVKAEHSDSFAIGVVVCDGNNKIYITGDTLYNDEIFKDLPDDLDYVFLPVNGKGNNMNMTDAKKFVEKTGTKNAVPLHIGLFDNLKPDDFDSDVKKIFELYKETII